MKRYHLTAEQQQALLDDMRELVQRILAINFNDPVEDERNIRQHAYLKGKLEQAQQTLEDDFPNPLAQDSKS